MGWGDIRQLGCYMLWPWKCLEIHALRRSFWCVFSLIQLTVILNASCPILEEDPKEYRWKGYGGNPFLGVPTVQRKKRPSVWRERDEEGCPQFPAAPLSLYLYCLPPRCAAALSGIQVHFPTSTVCLVLANELLEDQWNQSCKYICILACHLDFGVTMRRGCPVKSLG